MRTEVEVGEVQSTMRAVDTDSLFSPQVMERLMRIVLRAVTESDSHRRQARAERRVTSGVSHELAEEQW